MITRILVIGRVQTDSDGVVDPFGPTRSQCVAIEANQCRVGCDWQVTFLTETDARAELALRAIPCKAEMLVPSYHIFRCRMRPEHRYICRQIAPQKATYTDPATEIVMLILCGPRDRK